MNIINKGYRGNIFQRCEYYRSVKGLVFVISPKKSRCENFSPRYRLYIEYKGFTSVPPLYDRDSETFVQVFSSSSLVQEYISRLPLDSRDINFHFPYDFEIHEMYHGKVVYATPGSGKRTVTNFCGDTGNVLNGDDILLDSIQFCFHSFVENKEESVEENILRFFQFYDGDSEEVQRVYVRSREMIAKTVNEKDSRTGALKTVLIGDLNLMHLADYVFLQNNTALKCEEYNFEEEVALATYLGKGMYISTYISEVLLSDPDEM